MDTLRFFVPEGESLAELKPVPLSESELELERRIKACPSFLGENMVIVGEQVDFPEIKGDAVDLVGVAGDGAVVIIELKRGKSPSDVDFQAVKYAAYLSHLDAEQLAAVASKFLHRQENQDIRRRIKELGVDLAEGQVDLPSLLAAWFRRDVSEYASSINSTQRIIIVAEEFDTRIALAIEWLSRQGVAISGREYRQVDVNGQRVLCSRQVFPSPNLAEKFVPKAKASRATEPWKVDGRAYHLSALKPPVADALQRLIDRLGNAIVEQNWGQAYYVWLRGSGRNLLIHTYIRGSLDIGLHPTTEEGAKAFLAGYPDLNLTPKVSGGYKNSPFIRPHLDAGFPSERMVALLTDWLAGNGPG